MPDIETTPFLYAVCKSEGGVTELTIFDGNNASTIELSQLMLEQLIEELRGHDQSSN